MENNIDIIGQELFNKIRSRFQNLTLGNNEGIVTNNPSEARFFDFEYTENNKVLGNISVSLDENNLAVMYQQNFLEQENESTKKHWFNFLKELRLFAKKRLLNFDVRDITKSNLTKRDYKYLSNNSGDSNMTESKLYGTSKTSFQDIGSSRVQIKHSQPVNQELAAGRTQHIQNIYIETSEGERFKYPLKHLNGARAMARHIAEGGSMHDDFGKHIVELSQELNNLRNPDSIKVGEKILLSKNIPSNSENSQIIKNKKNNKLLDLDKKIYGPIIIQSKSYKDIKGRKVLNVLNQENKKLILSINCDTNELDVRIPGRKWMGSKPAKEEFENNLINDFC
mgnify:CR=1 FL=1